MQFTLTLDYQKLMRGKCAKLKNHKSPKHPHATIKKIKDTIRGTVQGRVQTGNAVPPLLAKAVAQNVYFECMKEIFVPINHGWEIVI